MACILKERYGDSPGIIAFTHGEAINGSLLRTPAIRERLIENSRAGRWLYGVQIQGDCSFLKAWPLEPWQSFILWPKPDEPYLANVPRDMLLNLNCVNFMPDFDPPPLARNVDLCVISRPSVIKRIEETLLTLRALMDLRPGLTATLIVPDPRRIELGSRSYAAQDIDRRYFELPLQLFSAKELKQLSFISTSEQAFGRFPLAQDMMTDVLARSRFMYLASHREGTPRVIAEALLTGTPCIVSRHLVSGILPSLDNSNSLAVEDDPAVAARQIADALENYARFWVDIAAARQSFSTSVNQPRLRAWLAAKIMAAGRPVSGRWLLDDLNMRLAGHGRRVNLQFMDKPESLLAWLDVIETLGGPGAPDPYDDDALFGRKSLNRPESHSPAWVKKAKSFAVRARRRLLP
ncbi:MAG TPA: hypothetical protein VGH23_13950 [Rhizomicrobium sp.]|jgi:hypothetical protein